MYVCIDTYTPILIQGEFSLKVRFILEQIYTFVAGVSACGQNLRTEEKEEIVLCSVTAAGNEPEPAQNNPPLFNLRVKADYK